jgi:hypothetical protein
LAIGDVLAIRSKPVWSNGGLTATDALWINPFQTAGLTPSFEIGKVALIIAGTGRGLHNRIAGATSTSHTFARPWLVTPDATTRYIVVEANWQPLASPMRGINNGNSADSVTISFPTQNFAVQTILVGLQTEDGGQNPAIDTLMPVRELYIFGQPEQVILQSGNYAASASDQNILVDTSAGPVTIQLPPRQSMISPKITVKKISADSNAVTIAAASGETIDGAASQSLPAQWSYLTVARINNDA